MLVEILLMSCESIGTAGGLRQVLVQITPMPSEFAITASGYFQREA